MSKMKTYFEICIQDIHEEGIDSLFSIDTIYLKYIATRQLKIIQYHLNEHISKYGWNKNK